MFNGKYSETLENTKDNLFATGKTRKDICLISVENSVLVSVLKSALLDLQIIVE